MLQSTHFSEIRVLVANQTHYVRLEKLVQFTGTKHFIFRQVEKDIVKHMVSRNNVALSTEDLSPAKTSSPRYTCIPHHLVLKLMKDLLMAKRAGCLQHQLAVQESVCYTP